MIYDKLSKGREENRKSIAVLLDPDKLKDQSKLDQILQLVSGCAVDYVFVGGSLLMNDHLDYVVQQAKSKLDIPVVLFPGDVTQVSAEADALLFLSLISGRNADLLIGRQVLAAPKIKQCGLETIATGYMLIDCGQPTTASYISGTQPIPYNKPDIALATAMAGEMLGLQCLYLDGGSGADKPISLEMIAAVKQNTTLPLIVGGGIRNEEQAKQAWEAGADIIVIGTAFEEDPEMLIDISSLAKNQV